MSKHEPSTSQLEKLIALVGVKLVSFDRGLVRLYPNDLLPRYNWIVADFDNRSPDPFGLLFVTVHRDGSSFGPENFYTVPVNVPELGGHARGRYAFLSFDSFNLRFESIRINLTTAQEYGHRPGQRVWMIRTKTAREYAVSGAVAQVDHCDARSAWRPRRRFRCSKCPMSPPVLLASSANASTTASLLALLADRPSETAF